MGRFPFVAMMLRKEFTKAMQYLGCIVENPELYPFLSGWDNLVHFAKYAPFCYGKKIKETVAFVGLDKRIHDKVFLRWKQTKFARSHRTPAERLDPIGSPLWHRAGMLRLSALKKTANSNAPSRTD